MNAILTNARNRFARLAAAAVLGAGAAVVVAGAVAPAATAVVADDPWTIIAPVPTTKANAPADDPWTSAKA
ncbi:hypothetical protein [Streptomyces sp. NRRL WC-3742]|uniref:hypothetical protein n=1 Tax=Streptomyces sp. NRRL WC-3742 TaxID=1463934 RepID=UPI00131C5218|nr:hypothetical protein [Streptomyces sp. NRRL WC-3742]